MRIMNKIVNFPCKMTILAHFHFLTKISRVTEKKNKKVNGGHLMKIAENNWLGIIPKPRVGAQLRGRKGSRR